MTWKESAGQIGQVMLEGEWYRGWTKAGVTTV
jgi:hypothetical protein